MGLLDMIKEHPHAALLGLTALGAATSKAPASYDFGGRMARGIESGFETGRKRRELELKEGKEKQSKEKEQQVRGLFRDIIAMASNPSIPPEQRQQHLQSQILPKYSLVDSNDVANALKALEAAKKLWKPEATPEQKGQAGLLESIARGGGQRVGPSRDVNVPLKPSAINKPAELLEGRLPSYTNLQQQGQLQNVPGPEGGTFMMPPASKDYQWVGTEQKALPKPEKALERIEQESERRAMGAAKVVKPPAVEQVSKNRRNKILWYAKILKGQTGDETPIGFEKPEDIMTMFDRIANDPNVKPTIRNMAEAGLKLIREELGITVKEGETVKFDDVSDYIKRALEGGGGAGGSF